MKELSRKDTWQILYKDKLVIEVGHWGVDRELEFKPMNDGKGVWNYYISIPEWLCNEEQFNSIWLEDKLIKFAESSPERITHDYYSNPISRMDSWHCGVTFYDKYGHSKGHRAVKFGCDYNHLYDEGNEYTLEFVYADAKATAEEILNWLMPK